jgi:hypothetical protein
VRPNVPEEGPMRPKHVEKEKKVWCTCTTNYVDGNSNKTLSYTQYDAEVQYFFIHMFNIALEL